MKEIDRIPKVYKRSGDLLRALEDNYTRYPVHAHQVMHQADRYSRFGSWNTMTVLRKSNAFIERLRKTDRVLSRDGLRRGQVKWPG